MTMIFIDGSHGEGGGQILRSSLTLSLLTGTPFRIENIRAKRKRPGVLRQHLTAIQAAAQIGDAAVEGAEVGASTVTFVPQAVRAGDYRFAIGTAGSTMLVLQTVLLPLVLAGSGSTLQLEGGTHNPAAPPFEFLEHAFLPLLRKMGAEVALELVRAGFAPAGGGCVRARIEPAKRLAPLSLNERGEIVKREIRAVVANLPFDIARREVETAGEELGWPEETRIAQTLSGSPGPGNAVSVRVESEHVTDVFTAFGQRGVRAEAVAHEAAKQAKRYINSNAAVGDHLADQLLLPLALGGGGSFTTTPLSSHTTTNMEIIAKFLDVPIATRELARGLWQVTVR